MHNVNKKYATSQIIVYAYPQIILSRCNLKILSVLQYNPPIELLAPTHYSINCKNPPSSRLAAECSVNTDIRRSGSKYSRRCGCEGFVSQDVEIRGDGKKQN